MLGGTEYGVIVQTHLLKLQKDADGWYWLDFAKMGAIQFFFITNPREWQCAELKVQPPNNQQGIRAGMHSKEAILSNESKLFGLPSTPKHIPFIVCCLPVSYLAFEKNQSPTPTW